MNNTKERNFSQDIKNWVQTIGIIIAAVWGVYTFIYKEIAVPKTAPINITVDLELKKIGESRSQSNPQKQDFIAVEMKAKATNPSSREIKLFPSVWIAYGYKITSIKRENNDFEEQCNKILNTRRGFYVERCSRLEKKGIVGIGDLFPDDSLKPDETIKRSLVLHLPVDEFDLLELRALITTVNNTKDYSLEWKFSNNVLEPVMYHMTDTGKKMIPLEEVKTLGIELQGAGAIAQLSLWQ